MAAKRQERLEARFAVFLGALIGAAVIATPFGWAQAVPLPVAAPQAAKPSAARPTAPAPVPGAPQAHIRQFAKPGETIALDANQRQLVDRISLNLSSIQTL